MPTYSTRFSGQRDARKYRDAGFRARQLNAGSRGYNTVSPIYSPGVLHGIPQQARADTWDHNQAKVQNAREADSHAAAVLGLDTQRQQNRMAQIQSDLTLAREGYPTTLGGNPASPAMQPPKAQAAAPAAQAPGLAPRPVDKGMVEAGLTLNNPMATPVQKEWAQQAIALKKAQLGARKPVQPAMTPPATAQGTVPAMQPPQFRGTPADVARQEVAWRQNQAQLGMDQERLGMAKTQSAEAVETNKLNRELAKSEEARRATTTGEWTDVVGADGNLRLYDRKTGNMKPMTDANGQPVKAPSKVGASKWVPDGKGGERFVTLGSDGTVQPVTDESGEPVTREPKDKDDSAMVHQVYSDVEKQFGVDKGPTILRGKKKVAWADATAEEQNEAIQREAEVRIARRRGGKTPQPPPAKSSAVQKAIEAARDGDLNAQNALAARGIAWQ